jgi:hypothetical protein
MGKFDDDAFRIIAASPDGVLQSDCEDLEVDSRNAHEREETS